LARKETFPDFRRSMVFRTASPEVRIELVFFMWLSDAYKQPVLATRYLAQLHSYQIPCRFHLVITGSTSQYYKLQTWLQTEGRDLPLGSVEFTSENTWEYRGLLKVYQLGQAANDRTLVAYCHSKGASMVQEINGECRTLMRETFAQWEAMVGHLDRDPTIDLVCYTTNKTFVWFNFWWARGSYLKRLERPTLQETDRWYYERWQTMVTDPSYKPVIYSTYRGEYNPDYDSVAATAALA
jgi:hypothetical protein